MDEIRKRASSLIPRGFNKWMKFYDWVIGNPGKYPLRHAAFHSSLIALIFLSGLPEVPAVGRVASFYTMAITLVGGGIYSLVYSKR